MLCVVSVLRVHKCTTECLVAQTPQNIFVALPFKSGQQRIDVWYDSRFSDQGKICMMSGLMVSPLQKAGHFSPSISHLDGLHMSVVIQHCHQASSSEWSRCSDAGVKRKPAHGPRGRGE